MIAYDISIKYMIAGYGAALGVLALYLVSLLLRWNRLKRDLQTLEELQSK